MSADRGTILGRVTARGGAAVYELFAGGTWRVTIDGADRPDRARELAATYEGRFDSPSEGPPGSGAVHDLARLVGGTAEYLGPYRGPDPSVVY